MKVGELIEALEGFNPNWEVHLIDNWDEEYMYSVKNVFNDMPWAPITQKQVCMIFIEKEEGLE